MLFGEEFAKQATTTVDQIRKCNKNGKKFLPGFHLQNYQAGHGAGYRSGLATLTTGDTITHLNTPAKQPRTETLDISHGLHFVECQKVIKFNYHILNLNTILPSLKKGIVTNLQGRHKRAFNDNWTVSTQDPRVLQTLPTIWVYRILGKQK